MCQVRQNSILLYDHQKSTTFIPHSGLCIIANINFASCFRTKNIRNGLLCSKHVYLPTFLIFFLDYSLTWDIYVAFNHNFKFLLPSNLNMLTYAKNALATIVATLINDSIAFSFLYICE